MADMSFYSNLLLRINLPESLFFSNLCTLMHMHSRGEGAHQEEATATLWEGIVLQRGGSVVGVYNMAWLLPQMGDPRGKLCGIGQRCRKENHSSFLWEKDNGFLPDHAPLPVLHVVHLVKDDPSNFTLQL